MNGYCLKKKSTKRIGGGFWENDILKMINCIALTGVCVITSIIKIPIKNVEALFFI